VTNLLREAGHVVYTPTLTGLGERGHLAHPGVDLALHVQDIVGLLEMEELNRVVLVGHSYGGMVITGVAARAGTRLRHLVYLDAFVPGSGQALISLLPAEMADGIRAAAKEHGDGWRIPPFRPERFGVTNAKDAAWLSRHLVSQPIHTFEQAVQAGNGDRLKRTYIYCSKHALGPFHQFVRLKDDRTWRFHEVKTGHDAMVTAPGEIAKILLGAV
jgi:pimeloyl-ACP methyl ester carboxylesterase